MINFTIEDYRLLKDWSGLDEDELSKIESHLDFNESMCGSVGNEELSDLVLTLAIRSNDMDIEIEDCLDFDNKRDFMEWNTTQHGDFDYEWSTWINEYSSSTDDISLFVEFESDVNGAYVREFIIKEIQKELDKGQVNKAKRNIDLLNNKLKGFDPSKIKNSDELDKFNESIIELIGLI